MAYYVSEMFDELRDLLNDATDTQLSFNTKKLYLNLGIAKLWPKLWRVIDTTVTVLADTYEYEYAFPADILDYHILSVELRGPNASDPYYRYNNYEFFAENYSDPHLFKITGTLPAAGSVFRIRFAVPIFFISAGSYAGAQTAEWTGSRLSMGLPVLYAMGMASARKLDDRQDTLRYSTTQAANGVTDDGIISSSQVWFGQFETELDSMAKPLPTARD